MSNDTLNLQTDQEASIDAIDIELFALDLSTCSRCTATLRNIEKAIEAVQQALKITRTDVRLHKILIDSEEQAGKHHFVTSPTVRVNGRDIAFKTLESHCDSCTDLCGCEEGTNCRVWLYQGREYNEAPVGLIVEAILSEFYARASWAPPKPVEFTGVNKNLQRFFSSKAKKEVSEESVCCSTVEGESCCEPSEKSSCCGTSESASCGCKDVAVSSELEYGVF